MNLVYKAAMLAAKYHDGQMDKAGKPYIYHCARVAMKLETEYRQAAGWLHDAIEDKRCTIEDLRNEEIPERVIEIILSVTRRENESYLDFVRRSCEDPDGRFVKIEDVDDNRDWRRMYSSIDLLTEEDKSRIKRYNKAMDILMGLEK